MLLVLLSCRGLTSVLSAAADCQVAAAHPYTSAGKVSLLGQALPREWISPGHHGQHLF